MWMGARVRVDCMQVPCVCDLIFSPTPLPLPSFNRQRIARGFLGRRAAARQREWWKDRKKKEEWAALLVQRHVRGLAGRRVLEVRTFRLCTFINHLNLPAWFCCSRTTYCARLDPCRCAHLPSLQRLRRDEALRNEAALWIQSRWRAHRGQLSTQVLKQARQMRREYNAAAYVQAHWRGRMGRNLLRKLRVEVCWFVWPRSPTPVNAQPPPPPPPLPFFAAFAALHIA
jgi:hypothetical protein